MRSVHAEDAGYEGGPGILTGMIGFNRSVGHGEYVSSVRIRTDRIPRSGRRRAVAQVSLSKEWVPSLSVPPWAIRPFDGSGVQSGPFPEVTEWRTRSVAALVACHESDSA